MKLINWLRKKLPFSFQDPIVEPKIVFKQEQVYDYAAVKRVREYLRAEHENIVARSMVPHSCREPETCTKEDCWKFVPDKIVSKPYHIGVCHCKDKCIL